MNTISGKRTLSIWGMVTLLFALASPATAATITKLASQPAGPITADGATLYVGNGNSVLSVPIAGGAATTLYSGATPCCVVGLTRIGTNLFWIDPNGDPDATAIFRSPASGGSITKIYSGFATGQPIVDGVGIATDGVKLYTTDDVQGRVHSLNQDGSAITQLGSRYGGFFAGEHFNTLTESGGILYIVDDGSQPSYSPPLVTSIPKTGGSFTTLHSGAPFVQPVAVAVGNGNIYVADHGANTIWQLPIAGGAPTALLSGTPFVSLGSNGLLFHDGALYVTDSSGIYRVDFGLPPTPTLSSISVTPSNPSINVGQTQQLTATGTFSDGSSRSLTSGGGAWAATGSMATVRFRHTATRLPNGKVLVVGGFNSSGTTGSAELYDPSSGTWSSAGSLSTDRYLHTATLLPNGKVLVAGGLTDPGHVVLASTEIYDSATNSWVAGPAMALGGRFIHGAALLSNGKVLVASGNHSYGGCFSVADAELYDPAANTWTPTGSRNFASDSPAILLQNGKVLMAGGQAGGCPNNNPGLTGAELYDPATGTWSLTGNLSVPRFAYGLALLLDGKVLFAGGRSNGSMTATADLYDPATGTFSAAAPMATARWDSDVPLAAAALPNGKVLVVGGISATGTPLANAELYDPSTDSWSPAGTMATPRRSQTETVLQDGRVLVAGGGNNSGILQSAELYTPSDDVTWSSSNGGVATVNQNGLATGQSPGTTTITATAGNVSGSTTLTVVSANEPPVADAGPDQTVEATGPSGAAVTLNGAASSDPDGDALSYTWTGAFGAVGGVSPTLTFALGTHTVNLAVYDGEATATDSVLITVRDTTAPVVSTPADFAVEATSAAGATIHYTAAAADIADPNPALSCSPAPGSTFPLGSTPVVCTATDASGNSASGGFTITVVDTTAPALSVPAPITIYATTVADATVFYSTSATDAVDPNPSLFCTPASGFTFPLGVTTVFCSAADTAGNGATASFTVQVIDSAAPVLSVPDTITTSPTGPDGATVTYAVSATDGFDADPEVSCTPASGTTFALGTTTVACTATDDAGNGASASFEVRVVHTFEGFFDPVENPNALNVVKAGSAVPLKFSLHGDFGLGTFAPGYPRSQTVACDVTSSVNGVDETVTAGGSSLAYDASLDQYKYVWKTEKTWVGTCRQLVVKLSDGTFHWANFMLK